MSSIHVFQSYRYRRTREPFRTFVSSRTFPALPLPSFPSSLKNPSKPPIHHIDLLLPPAFLRCPSPITAASKATFFFSSIRRSIQTYMADCSEQQAQQLRLDLDELKHLQSIARRPSVVSLLSSEIHNVDAKLSKLAMQPPIPPEKAPPSVTSNVMKYNTLGSFSWDQDNEKIRIYLFLQGVDPEKTESDIKPSSVDIKMHDVQGKNYRYAIPKLNKEIVPEKSKVVVKPTRVVITLIKSSKGNWLDLHFKEDKFKPNLDKEKDPMAGIMDLMKNMYEEGDEDMKRTIAKAWSDARSGKTTDSLKDFP